MSTRPNESTPWSAGVLSSKRLQGETKTSKGAIFATATPRAGTLARV